MTMLEGILLGLLEGITQFLPVSSLGHAALAQSFFSFNETHTVALIGVLHIATALAALVYFWSDIWMVLQALLRRLSRLPVNAKDLVLLKALFLGTIPAVVVGFFIEPYTYNALKNTGLIAGILFLTSVFLMYAEWRYYVRPVHEQVTVRNGFLIGLFQVLALLPGFSRSGATIGGGMLLGLSRYEAVRFSFILAIPVTILIGVRKLLQVIVATGPIDFAPIIVAGVMAFFSAILCIHLFLVYARKYTLWPFIWYGVILSCLVWYVSFIS